MLARLIEPWEPSACFVLVFTGVAALYHRGARRLPVSLARRFAFWSGMLLFYVNLHTGLDYYAQHQFSAHRLQHMALHHLAPMVLMVSYPGTVLRAGLPLRWRVRLRRAERSRAGRGLAACLFNPALVSVLFVALVLLWLIPSLQEASMLDWRLYRLMNWSVAISGLMYWWLVLDHRPSPPARMPAGFRVLSPTLTMTPQIVAGAILAFSNRDLYPIFDLCGRAFLFDAVTDQRIGGLIMWIPAALIEAIGALIALRHWMRLSRLGRLDRARALRRPAPRQPPPLPVGGA